MSSTGPLEQAKPTCDVGPFISESGPSRHFAATQQFGRFQSEADIQRAALTEPDL